MDAETTVGTTQAQSTVETASQDKGTDTTQTADTSDKTETPAEPTLYELPDGRKVEADTLTKEWKENFYPDYTRKSQALAEYEKAGVVIKTNEEQVPEWKNPDYVPKSYAEVIEIAKQEMKNDLLGEQQRIDQQRQQANDFVQGQLNGIKKTEPNLDENLLFQHAVKYKFNDLTAAFQNMKDLNVAVKLAEKKTADNINKRDVPIAGKPGDGGKTVEGIDYNSITHDRSSPQEWLAQLKGK